MTIFVQQPVFAKHILIAAGGTGGHVYPAIAVAENLRSRGYGVSWLGTEKGIEARVVPEKDFPIYFITSVGVRGKGLVNAITAPLMMLKGLWQSIVVIHRVKPAVILGMGGFVSVPGGIASFIMRKSLVIHEQNAVAGSANRLLSKIAVRVLSGFEHVLPNAERIGNPVRLDITQLPTKNISSDPTVPLHLLVLGGSLGAKAINDVMPKMLKQFSGKQRPVVWHQTGKTTYDATLALYQQEQLSVDGTNIKVTAFIENMAAAYQWADIILCRAGAITLAEITCVGLPSLLVPLPNAIDNHQYKNAESLANQHAAVLLPQSELSADKLMMTLVALSTDRTRLQRMAQQAKKIAEPKAAQRVADICLEVSAKKSGGAHG